MTVMKAVVCTPGRSGSLRLEEVPRPSLDEAPGGRGVLVRVARVGLDGTDREIAGGLYGTAPPGSPFLVLGHESLGLVEAVGPAVRGLSPGQAVVAMVRRPGSSVYDTLGMPDLTTDEGYTERGIRGAHGFLTEYYVDLEEFLVPVPDLLRPVGVLLEPVSVVEKGLAQAWEVQRRLRVWQPRRALVLGAGPIGLLATLALRLRGLQVATFSRNPPDSLNANLAREVGAVYLSSADYTLERATREHGPFDLVFEATGFSPLAFEAVLALARNGVLVLASVTGGRGEATLPVDAINQALVLGNRLVVGTVSANRGHFETAVADLLRAQAVYPGWASRLFTHRFRGLERYREAFEALRGGSLKVVVEVSDL